MEPTKPKLPREAIELYNDLILPESNSGIPDSGITRLRERIPPQHQNRKLSACSSALPQQGLCDSKLTGQNCR
jgi:hypothetical protein